MQTFLIEFSGGKRVVVEAESRIHALRQIVEEDHNLYTDEDFSVKIIHEVLLSEVLN